jgi:hypothetical protein
VAGLAETLDGTGLFYHHLLVVLRKKSDRT